MTSKPNWTKKRILEKIKKFITPKEIENIVKISPKKITITRDFRRSKDGLNARLEKLFSFKVTRIFYSLFNVRAKNNLNRQNKRN